MDFFFLFFPRSKSRWTCWSPIGSWRKHWWLGEYSLFLLKGFVRVEEKGREQPNPLYWEMYWTNWKLRKWWPIDSSSAKHIGQSINNHQTCASYDYPLSKSHLREPPMGMDSYFFCACMGFNNFPSLVYTNVFKRWGMMRGVPIAQRVGWEPHDHTFIINK